ncbi:histidine kinase dimerization/phospho-acceptor domain-containing protein [Actinomadura rudentiformis]|uniref:Signal transduction histidine-protein kinase/phosphatase MprB n=1 Tax=Actinomadura rudentiformis TaxID=359158 RepID=A0A6H9YR61_9ACTN|nr:histidine kinase dimerization/phospho-acceptor domain-containing protein [Actinomadura rudentiformis]KAB2341800.1 HAMP domain-containing protein [Actinomadura rudentiformis]
MRRTLVLVSLAVTSMVALAFLIPLGLTVREIARDRALTTAERQASALGPVLVVTQDPAALERAVASTQAGAAQRMRVHLPDGQIIPRADSDTGRRAKPAQLAEAGRRGRSYTAGVDGGHALLQPVSLDGGRAAVVEVYVPDGDLSQGVWKAWVVMTLVAGALVAGSVAVADRLGARVIRSTRRLAEAAGSFGDGDLSVRIDPDGPPELVEAGVAFNAMADHVVQLLAAEREMAADLSHRLRTPLAALRLNAEALGDGPVPDQTREAVDRLEREVDLIIRTVRRPTGRGSCDASKVLAERVAFWSVLAEDEGRSCELIGANRPAELPLPASELAAAVDALLGNVFRHTAEGTAFAVTLHVGQGVTGILVADAGPGIADPDAALQRGRSTGGSTGLGLDIARRAAEATGGYVRIHRSVLGGAQVQMWFRTRWLPPQRRSRRLVRRRHSRT